MSGTELLVPTFHSSIVAGRGEKLFFVRGGSHGHASNVGSHSLQICVLLKPKNINMGINMRCR
jgi:hypothetical protein